MEHDVEIGIEHRKNPAHHQGHQPVFEDGFGIARDQADDGGGGDEVGRAEPGMLGDGQEQGIENDDSQTDEQVLDRMDPDAGS